MVNGPTSKWLDVSWQRKSEHHVHYNFCVIDKSLMINIKTLKKQESSVDLFIRTSFINSQGLLRGLPASTLSKYISISTSHSTTCRTSNVLYLRKNGLGPLKTVARALECFCITFFRLAPPYP